MSRRTRALLVLVSSLAVCAALGGRAYAGVAAPGAVFTQSNTPVNTVRVFTRNADGTLTAAGSVATGGAGLSANPPLGFPVLDSAGPVELASDGDNRGCLFAVNGGSNTVSSFTYGPGGLVLADQEPTNGSRPASVTSTQGGNLVYVLNSDYTSASIQGYYASSSCNLTAIPGSFRLVPTQTSIPAQISFNQRGTVLAVSERFGNGGAGAIDIFPVDASGVAGAPVVNASVTPTPYGLAWTERDQLSVSNEDITTGGAGASFATYQLTKANTLVPIDSKPSPGAACWNVITNDKRFVYVSNPLGQVEGGNSILPFRMAPDGTVTALAGVNTTFNSIDLGLSHDSKYLYVLSVDLLGPTGTSAIDEYAVDHATGLLTPIGTQLMPGLTTSGLASW